MPSAPEHAARLTMFDLDAYLERIGLSGRPGIAEVHRAHVTSIPFENLDPQRGVPVSLELDDVQRKLVAEGRGGYCFEHNTLLGAALEALGAEVEPMLGRVGPRELDTRARSHLVLRVKEDGEVWHADVGYGAGTLLDPVPFGAGGPYQQSGWHFRVVADAGRLVLQARGHDGEWADEYSFTPEPAPFVDLETSNWFTCTHPRSHFVRGLVVAANAADGIRTVLSDWSGTLRLMEQAPAGETVTTPERSAVPELLATRFGLPGWELDPGGRLARIEDSPAQ
ncbi:MAG: arylamine N-acetyltransferase family protein [Solirubrobacteraceae bacterium]